MATAAQRTRDLQIRIRDRLGIEVDWLAVETLRRAQLTLHNWAELECGTGDDKHTWAIERDEDTGKPIMRHEYRNHRGEWVTNHWPTGDRERGALKRVQATCASLGIHYYHQTDPRGCSLYVSTEPLTDTNYTNGVACCD